MTDSRDAAEIRLLRRLAAAWRVQTSYIDIEGRRQRASPEALLAVLRALDAPLATVSEAAEALRDTLRTRWRRIVEPVAVAWDGRGAVTLRMPAAARDARATCRLRLEDGRERSWTAAAADLPPTGRREVDGAVHVCVRLELQDPLPAGYHQLSVDIAGLEGEALIIAAPRQTFVSPDDQTGRAWGVFLPLYALNSERSWGAGDLADLAALLDLIAARGGGVVATLPLLAAFLDDPFDPSPYTPASRLFWNEFYLAPERLPEFEGCSEARTLFASPEIQAALAQLRAAAWVDYRRVAALKRQVLDALARSLLVTGGERLATFRRFVEGRPEVRTYARFRAAVERTRRHWQTWLERARTGILQPWDYGEAAAHYHAYVQWACEEQLADLSQAARAHGPGLYLDLPLGVHSSGFDTWRYPDAFAAEAAAGAPPDPFFTKGQNWGFPPLHPHRLREDGYGYVVATLRHHMRHAGVLRIDHVMGLHRLFWVPRGFPATDGVYVRYRPEELYAILALESRRHGTLVVGEDLGTVPGFVRRRMRRHGVHSMYVVQYEVQPSPLPVLRPVPADALAALNTHDMPTFAAFWAAADVGDRETMGLLDEAGARAELSARSEVRARLIAFLRQAGVLSGGDAPSEAPDVLRGLLRWLAAGPARIVIVNLEDLWLEPRSQNVPGTGPDRGNWQRKSREARERFTSLPDVERVLAEIDALRREPHRPA